MGNQLDKPVLILNKGWSAIDACTARDAISDVCADKAKFICPETYVPHSMEQWLDLPVSENSPFIQGVMSRIRVPEVIVCQYDRVPKRKVVFSRRNLWKRDHQRCQYCCVRPKPDDITIDHVVPRSKGGRTSFDNCVLACAKCNRKKDNRTPEQARMSLTKLVRVDGKLVKEHYTKPKVPKWSPIYAMARYNEIPKSWSQFLQGVIDDLYWNTELED